ncbi:hypothetical protein ABB37_08073 [Leptomonas pyrrhocoris]|uniref:PDZ domain-containing protein n=1 Tax=Leptomonas pyrrhocoris TaxID=157538 RepID=A0A0N0VDK2_LEPPY|nr:hypothetical protein ABB37_08073 [Leptomonas pyrrhocoris]KPA75894.1 hypothetical protein ABB37_08073 [Leptomonas pyrrhocoris]|eukprot:XP_015654333.1 hypothetical protein ABB37_08073 [Leptomonas pyrrhocoris]
MRSLTTSPPLRAPFSLQPPLLPHILLLHSRSPPVSRHAAAPDTEWVQTFLKAHVDDTVARRLPTMIAQEVRRQLRGVHPVAVAASSSFSPSPSPSSSPPRDGGRVRAASTATGTISSSGSNGGGAVDLRAAVGLPPLPPPPPPANALDDEIAEKRAASSSPSSHIPSPADEARRQRAQILSAIEDIERQVNALQRTVDQAADDGDLRRRRWACLCAALDTRMKASLRADRSKEVAGSPVVAAEQAELPFHLRLEHLLDLKEETALLSTLERVVGCLLPATATSAANEGGASATARRNPVTSPVNTDPMHRPVRSLSHFYGEGATASPVLPTQQLNYAEQHPHPQQQFSSLSPSMPSPIGPAPPSSGEPPSPQPVAPSGATRGLHPRVVPPKPEATSTATAVLSEPQPRPPLQHGNVSRGVRSITTKGAVVAASPPSAPSNVKSPSTYASDAPANVSSISDFDGSTRPNGLGGTAVRRPVLAPYECVDSTTTRDGTGRVQTDDRHRARRTASAGASLAPRTAGTAGPPAQPSAHREATTLHQGPLASSHATAATRSITLGIDAVNVPAGVLPDALDRHGAVRVQSVAPHQLAEKAGLCRGDILLSVDRRGIQSCEQLRDVLTAVPPTQSSLAVELYRHTAHQIITVLLKL